MCAKRQPTLPEVVHLFFLLDPLLPHLGGTIVDFAASGGKLVGRVVVVVAERGVDFFVGEARIQSVGEVLHDLHVEADVEVLVFDVRHRVPVTQDNFLGSLVWSKPC